MATSRGTGRIAGMGTLWKVLVVVVPLVAYVVGPLTTSDAEEESGQRGGETDDDTGGDEAGCAGCGGCADREGLDVHGVLSSGCEEDTAGRQ